MMEYCLFCRPDTGGNHQRFCPHHPGNKHRPEYRFTYPMMTSWICPRCARVWPCSVEECGCSQPGVANGTAVGDETLYYMTRGPGKVWDMGGKRCQGEDDSDDRGGD